MERKNRLITTDTQGAPDGTRWPLDALTMRLLVTRAAEDAARTCATLAAARHTVLASPVLVFEPMETPWPHQALDGIVATSARAFAYLGGEPDAAIRRTVPLFLVGHRTESIAREHGFAGPATVAKDGAALVAILRPRPTMRLVYLAGLDRKPDLEEGLVRHRLIVIETYAAAPATALATDVALALHAGAIDGILHYSQRSATIFLALSAAIGLDVSGFRHFCLSQDVAAPLADAGCAAVDIAERPDEAAMMALVERVGTDEG